MPLASIFPISGTRGDVRPVEFKELTYRNLAGARPASLLAIINRTLSFPQPVGAFSNEPIDGDSFAHLPGGSQPTNRAGPSPDGMYELPCEEPLGAMSHGKPWSMMLVELERRRWEPTVVADPRPSRRHRCRSVEGFRKGRVIAQVWDHETVDGVRYRTFTISRTMETDQGPRTSRDLSLGDIRDCRKALRTLKKWRRDDKRRNRRTLLRRLLSW
jgi:hypothetical protein